MLFCYVTSRQEVFMERKAKSNNCAYTLDQLIDMLVKARDVHGGDTRVLVISETCIGRPPALQCGIADNVPFTGNAAYKNDEQYTGISYGWGIDDRVEDFFGKDHEVNPLTIAHQHGRPDAEVAIVIF